MQAVIIVLGSVIDQAEPTTTFADEMSNPTDDRQVTIYYTSLDTDGQATAREVRSIFEEAGLEVRPGESPAGVTYEPPGFGGPSHSDLVVVVLDWITHHLAIAGGGYIAAKFFGAAANDAGKDAWAAIKVGIARLWHHQWAKRAPRAVWLLLPVPMPEGVRWIGFKLPVSGEDAMAALTHLEDVVLPSPSPSQAITWLKWNQAEGRWHGV